MYALDVSSCSWDLSRTKLTSFLIRLMAVREHAMPPPGAEYGSDAYNAYDSRQITLRYHPERTASNLAKAGNQKDDASIGVQMLKSFGDQYDPGFMPRHWSGATTFYYLKVTGSLKDFE